MEHRCGQRASVNLVVRLTGQADAIGTGRLRDVSSTGAFLQTDLELPLLCSVRIELIGSAQRASSYCEGSGYVVRKAAGGVGIEWFAPVSDFVRMPAENIFSRRRFASLAHELSPIPEQERP
jgi:hypothetical protein